MYYIREVDKFNKLLKMFDIIKLKGNQVILPIKEEVLTDKYAYKLAKKTKKIFQNLNSNKIVLSKIIKKQENYCNYLLSYGFDISDGKWLWELLSCKSIDYIVEKMKLNKQEIMLSVMINNISDITLYNIKKLSKEYKRMNIVTNHINKLKKIEDELLEKEGIMITVTNNKKKCLLRSNIILNIDFPVELVNQYQIKENAIILNIQGNIKIKKKRFNGICINDYEIKSIQRIEEKNLENKFFLKEIYESNLYKKQPIEEIQKMIEKDNIQIAWLQGIREII